LPATLKDPASQPTSFYYDAKGRLTNRMDNVGTTLYGYDAKTKCATITC
jgi:YD repeat-containing protein